jgi:hypothetical protein
MKKLLLSAFSLFALSAASLANAQVHVDGYYRNNGTYVAPHYRSAPNSTVTDNYSFKGNTNPYTGSVGTNTYPNSPSSPYYSGGAPNPRTSYGNSGSSSLYGY